MGRIEGGKVTRTMICFNFKKYKHIIQLKRENFTYKIILKTLGCNILTVQTKIKLN